jgi:hypothetical protein
MNKLIDFYEKHLPEDLVLKLPENSSIENKEAFEKTREFLLKDAALEFFNLRFRKILLKQIEMRESRNSIVHFHTDCIYSKSTMEKYLSLLDENDELVIRYKNSDFGDWIGNAKDLGIL